MIHKTCRLTWRVARILYRSLHEDRPLVGAHTWEQTSSLEKGSPARLLRYLMCPCCHCTEAGLLLPSTHVYMGGVHSIALYHKISGWITTHYLFSAISHCLVFDWGCRIKLSRAYTELNVLLCTARRRQSCDVMQRVAVGRFAFDTCN